MLRFHRDRAAAGVPTSSLADIAFLLLIFFLVTTVFDEEKGLPLVLPEADNPVPVSPDNLLRLTVRADGLVEVRRGASTRAQTIAASEVEALWRGEVAGNADLIAALFTEPDAPYHRMVDVLDALRQAGAERISLQLAAAR